MKIKKKIILLFSFIIMSLASYSLLAEYSEIEDTFITKEQAKKIAENFVEAEKENFPSWNEVFIKQQYTIYSSNGMVAGYEISFNDKKGESRGSIIVSPDQNETIIPSFSENGGSFSNALIEYYENFLKKKFDDLGLSPKEFIILGKIPFNFALGVKFKESDNLEKNNFISQDGWFIFSPYPGSQNKLYKKNKIKSRSVKRGNEENKDFYNALINGDKNSKFFQTESSGKINGMNQKILPRSTTSSSISGGSVEKSGKLFSNLYQENREWTKGGVNSNKKCYAGCGPVGWAILLDYWDRNGYPNLISSISDNNNRKTDDFYIRGAINDLREDLETTCTDSGSGNTNPWNIDQGDSFIKRKGYESNISTNMNFEPGFWDVIRDINNKRPPLILFNTNDDLFNIPDHYVVAYAYEDKSGKASDRFKVKTGWPEPTDRWYNRNTISGWGAGVTSVEISSPPDPYFDGTGSLIDPENKDGCYGCDRDYVKLHSHGELASAGFFQILKVPGVCESITLTGLDSASIEVRSWSGRGEDSKYYTANNNSIIPLSTAWNLVAFKTSKPIKTGSTKLVKAACLSNNKSNVSEVFGSPMKFSGNYYWGGNASIITHSNSQYNYATQTGYGRTKDISVLLRNQKTLSAFQVTNSKSCKKIKFKTPVTVNLSWKLWDEKNWKGSKDINNNDIFTFPDDSLWWILQIKSPKISGSGKEITAICVK